MLPANLLYAHVLQGLISMLAPKADIARRLLTALLSDAYPYPCVRMFHFVSQRMMANKMYPDVVRAGKSGDAVFLDLGVSQYVHLLCSPAFC